MNGPAGKIRFTSLAAASGAPGAADQISKNRIVSYTVQQVDPGFYGPQSWRFIYRRGRSVPRPGSPTIEAEAGKIYYLGRFIANNLTQTARLEGQADHDLVAFRRKSPALGQAEISDVSEQLGISCWAQDVTASIIKGQKVLQEATAACYP